VKPGIPASLGPLFELSERKTRMTIPNSHADLLDWETQAFAHVATVGPRGEPQNNPVWFDWDGTHLKFSQTTTRQKYHNVQREKRVAMSILDPENPYRYLEIRGELDGMDPDPDLGFIDRMANKYLARERYPWHQEGDERVVVKVRPVHYTSMG
jgi:PPOX class probable F420-dependent enzyme